MKLHNHDMMMMRKLFPVPAGIQRLPVQWERAHPFLRAMYADRYYEYVNATHGPAALHTERVNVYEVLNFIRGVQPNNCSK